MQPFVEIKGQTVGALHPRRQRPDAVALHRRRTESAIHVEPEFFGRGYICNSGQVVYRTDIHRAGRADDE